MQSKSFRRFDVYVLSLSQHSIFFLPMDYTDFEILVRWGVEPLGVPSGY